MLPAPEPLNDVSKRTYYALQVINLANAAGTTATPFTAQTGLVQPGSGTGSFAVRPTSVEATAGTRSS